MRICNKIDENLKMEQQLNDECLLIIIIITTITIITSEMPTIQACN